MEIIGHRGAKGLAPENTLAGISFAIKRKVNWIEFDVRLTKDGELVVVHDNTLQRISDGRGRVKDYRLAEIQAIATKSGEPIPTFKEVLYAIGDKAKIDIELKEKGCAKKVVTAIQKQVAAGRPIDDFIVSSFKPWVLREVYRLDRKVPLLLLQSGWPLLFLMVPQVKLSGVGFSRYAAPKLIIKLAKKRGLWTVVWTINSKTEARFFKSAGVDAIVTDVPHAFTSAGPLVRRLLLTGTVLILILVLLFGYIVRL